MHERLAGEVTLVVDTNLFLECRALSELLWHELGFARIELIVSRPVQQELDNHKKNERGRTFKKALAATKLLRELVTSGQMALVIRDTEPRVTLSIMPASRIEPDLNDQLDPSHNDDAILLRMLQYQRDNGAANVRLITHDTGPMATAVSLGIPFIPIPDAWLMREQDDAATKEANKLKGELQRLRSQEPQFEVKMVDEDGNEISRLDVQVGIYEPLTFHEVSTFMEEFQKHFPMATEFGSAETTPKPQQLPGFRALRGITVTEFTPATDGDIRKYQHESYPEWVSDCRDKLDNLHRRLNARVEWPKIEFVISNSGTRPATRSLVKFLAQGNVEICPPETPDDDEGSPPARGIDSITLPNPPSPPRGMWKEKISHSASRMAEMMAGRFNDPFATRVSNHFLDLPNLRPPSPRDPDSFYWKGGRPSIAESMIELTCENWRHGVGDEHFLFRVTASNTESVSGAIQCEIHAENLTDPEMITLPVRIERLSQSTFDHAQTLIARLRAG
jgi:PIN domain